MAAAGDILDRLERAPQRHGTRTAVPDPSRHPIELAGVHVAFDGRPVLDGLSVTVEPGELVALAGPSGCGKSTVLGVLLGLVEPDAGEVQIGGVDLRRLDPAAWHAQLAWVPQRPHLFAATIADNVRCARRDASDQAVRRALAEARLADVVARFPDGAETRLGDRGAGLSAGERRRLALARAFLRDAPLLLLDEPTAALDGATEEEVAGAVRRLVRGRTAIVVAHRPALLAIADRAVELGRVEVAA
jgi:ATP-binding cassette subfamily C protein CydCD